MSIDLYYLNLSPPSRAVFITARHLDIEVNIKEVDLLKGEHMTEDYLKINPCHTVPTIVDGDLVLWESRAIMQYLCNKYGPDSSLYPRAAEERAVVDKMLNFDMTYSAAIHEVLANSFRGFETTEQQLNEMNKYLKLMDTLIDGNQYVAGEQMTIADISIAQSTTMCAIDDFKQLEDFPHLKEWFERISCEAIDFKQLTEKASQEFKAIIAAKKDEK